MCAQFEALYSKVFQGHPRSWPCVKHLASRSFQSQVTQIRVHQKRRFWGVFLHKIDFPGQTVNIYSIPYIFWKLLFQRLIWHIWGPATSILWPVRFFVTLWESTGCISWNLVIWCFLGICYSEDSAEIVESGAISLSMSESAVGRSFQQWSSFAKAVISPFCIFLCNCFWDQGQRSDVNLSSNNDL